MSNVIPFPQSRIVQVVVGRDVADPERRFFVMVSDEVMREEIAWDGPSYADALLAASEWVNQGYRLDDIYGHGRLGNA